MRASLRLLAWGLPALALVWATILAVKDRDHVYAPGPVSVSHAMFASDCAKCHEAWRDVPDSKCIRCHDGPLHHADQVFHGGGGAAPRCASCHAEHRGRPLLTAIADSHCVQCHRDLTTRGTPRFERRITGFGVDHPDFGFIRRNENDPAQLEFNHQKHLAKAFAPAEGLETMLVATGIPPPEAKKRNRLECTDCHRLDAGRKLMAPIRYATHCASCHPLEYDGRMKRDATAGRATADVVPHDRPEVIHRYLVGRFFEYADAHPEAVAAGAAGGGRDDGDDDDDDRGRGRLRPRASASVPATARTTAEWVRGEVAAIEEQLFMRDKSRCFRCHSMKLREPPRAGPGALASGSRPEGPAGGLRPPSERGAVASGARPEPLGFRVEIVPTRIPARWLAHATFDHHAHRSMTCTSCHASARDSIGTADIDLPALQSCRECHRERNGARTACASCHVYHDKSAESRYEGKLPRDGLKPGGGGMPATPAPAGGAVR
jgi:hypothetical protein